MRILTFLTALSLALSTQAQTLIKPGDPSIHYEWLIPSRDFYKVTVLDSTGHKKMELMNDQIQVIDTVHDRIISARIRQAPFGRLFTDTSICTRSLIPIRLHEFDQPRSFEHDFRFEGKKAYTYELNKGIKKKDTMNMEEGYFDENSVEGFFSVMNFEKGKQYKINAFRLGEPGDINPFVMEYVFDDTWGSPGDNQLNCHVIRFKNAYSKGYIWIDQSRHKMVKELIEMDNGSKVLIVER